MIKLEHVDKYFGDLHVLKDVNLEVAEGEKLVIIGPSGSGKSTTVRCMNFLEEPTSGRVYIDGQELTNKNKTRIVRDNMSMVFQQFNLYPHMTVLKNLTLAPMKLHHKTRAEAEELAYHYLEVVASGTKRMSTLRSCPAASSSASPLHAPSAHRPRSSCSTSRLRPSTLRPSRKCWMSW